MFSHNLMTHYQLRHRRIMVTHDPLPSRPGIHMYVFKARFPKVSQLPADEHMIQGLRIHVEEIAIPLFRRSADDLVQVPHHPVEDLHGGGDTKLVEVPRGDDLRGGCLREEGVDEVADEVGLREAVEDGAVDGGPGGPVEGGAAAFGA